MSTYTAIEQAIIDQAISLTAINLNEFTCGNDIDTIMHHMKDQSAKWGALVGFGGGARQARESFSGLSPIGADMGKGQRWSWRIAVTFIIRFAGDTQEIEDDIRVGIDAAKSFFSDAGERRLGGLVPYSQVVGISPVDSVNINDMPVYLLEFVVEVWDKI